MARLTKIEMVDELQMIATSGMKQDDIPVDITVNGETNQVSLIHGIIFLWKMRKALRDKDATINIAVNFIRG